MNDGREDRYQARIIKYVHMVGVPNSRTGQMEFFVDEVDLSDNPRQANDELNRDAILYMQAEVAYINSQKGWYDETRTFGEDIALLHSEVSEALEAYRGWGTGHYFKFDGVDSHEHYPADDPVAHHFIDMGMVPKPEGVGSELADVLIRLLDTCERYDIDLYAEWRAKVEYNKLRPVRHGGKKL